MKVLFTEPAFGMFYVETHPGVLRPAVKAVVNWLKDQAETVTGLRA